MTLQTRCTKNGRACKQYCVLCTGTWVKPHVWNLGKVSPLPKRSESCQLPCGCEATFPAWPEIATSLVQELTQVSEASQAVLPLHSWLVPAIDKSFQLLILLAELLIQLAEFPDLIAQLGEALHLAFAI